MTIYKCPYIHLKIIFINVFFFAFSPNGFSQNIFTGRIVDKNEIGIPYVNVIFIDKDSVYLSGDISNEDGYFRIFQSHNGVILKISHVGYDDVHINVSDSSFNMHLGDIMLKESYFQLDNIVIASYRPSIIIEDNSLITIIDNSVLATVGTAEDILKYIPGVISHDGLFDVIGKGTPIFYINNRKVWNETELKQLKSEDISKVELIRSPNSSYDTENRAVIKIYTKLKSEGISVNMMENLIFSNHFSNYVDANLNYNIDRLNLSLSISNNYRNSERNFDEYQINYTDTLWSEMKKYQYLTTQCFYNYSIGINYDVNKKNSIGVRYIRVNNNLDFKTGYNNYYIYAYDNFYEHVKNDFNMRNKTNQNNINLFYRGELADKINIQLDIDYLSNNFKNIQNIHEIFSNREGNVHIFSQNTYNIYAGKFLCEYVISKKLLFQSGIEFIYINGDGYLSNPDNIIKDNSYKNDEGKKSVFINSKYLLSKFHFNAGLWICQ
jgi:hypothetical protein